MRAMFADQSVPPLFVAINHQFFPENLDRLDWLFLGEFTDGGNRVPVAPQQLPTGTAATYPGQKLVFFARQHLISSAIPLSNLRDGFKTCPLQLFLLFIQHLFVTELFENFENGHPLTAAPKT